MHKDRQGPCAFCDGSLLLALLTGVSGDPREAFAIWVSAFFTELDRAHPPSAADSAAQLIRRNLAQPLDVPAIARGLNVTPSYLERSFAHRFGVSLRAYHSSTRIAAALPQILVEKVEVVALRLGYRSKKNFYRAFKQTVGLTPSAFRQLTPDQQSALRKGVRESLEGSAGQAVRSRSDGRN
jgi:AraC-like DNA-binding protein